MSNTFKLARTACFCALAAAGMTSAHAGPVVIDEFNGNQLLEDATTNGQGVAAINYVAAGILGGNRDLFVTKTGNAVSDASNRATSVLISFDGTNNVFEWANQQSAFGEAVIRWDGNSSAPVDGDLNGELTRAEFDASANKTGLGGFNLESLGEFFQFSVISSDIGFDFRIELFSDAGTGFAYVDLASQAHINDESTPIPLTSFTALCGTPFENVPVTVGLPPDVNELYCGTGFDLNNIGMIQITLRTAGNTDTVIDDFRVIPEPGTLALAGLTLVGLALQRRRKYA